jgi:hypothetical protein
MLMKRYVVGTYSICSRCVFSDKSLILRICGNYCANKRGNEQTSQIQVFSKF